MILYTLLTLMTAWAHSKTTLTNPGTVARGVIPSEGEEGAESSRQTLYGRCELYKPTRPLKIQDEAGPFSVDLGVTEKEDVVKVLEVRRKRGS
ncbi:unnamed protein product [Ascophyllum nodosum]